MNGTSALFLQILMLLGGGILAGTLFKRIGLGTVLGYLAAGVVMGPVLRLVEGDGEEILHIGELGVVFLLFVIGLELKLSRLWALRRQIFGLGLAQVLATGALLWAALSLGFGLSPQAGAVIGAGLALSSTAFALQLLEEAGETNTRHGQAAFSVLLLQDLAVVPLLALLPVLAPMSGGTGFDPMGFAISIGAVVALVAAGRYLLNPVFSVIAKAGAHEVMIAAALFVVLGSAMLMAVAGFSMAMGAFIAGVLLAESTYRHELEADIEPFRGILLGLFFIAVGLSLDLAILRDNWAVILIAAPALMAAKALVLYVLGRLFGGSHNDAVRVAALLPQGGEFAFVLFSAAAALGIFPPSTASLLVAVVTLSMALTPLAAFIGGKLIVETQEEELEEDFAGAGGADVLMIGFSRFAQIAAQVLLTSGREVTIIDASADRIRTAARFGFRIYYGSGLRRDILEAAGIRQAKIVAVCTAKRETTDAIVALVQAEFPNVRLYVRSYDRNHTLHLRALGVDYEIRETVESALVFGGKALTGLGVDAERAQAMVDDVRRRDRERLREQIAENAAAVANPATPEPLVPPKRRPREEQAPQGEPAAP